MASVGLSANISGGLGGFSGPGRGCGGNETPPRAGKGGPKAHYDEPQTPPGAPKKPQGKPHSPASPLPSIVAELLPGAPVDPNEPHTDVGPVRPNYTPLTQPTHMRGLNTKQRLEGSTSSWPNQISEASNTSNNSDTSDTEAASDTESNQGNKPKRTRLE